MEAVEKNNWRAVNSSDIADFSVIVARETMKDKEIRQALHILETLRYVHMADRHKEIPAAYQHTFDWVSQESERQKDPEPLDDGKVPE